MPDPPEKKVVSIEDLNASAQGASGLNLYRLTAVQGVVTWLAILLLASIFLVIGYVCYDWHCRLPSLPQLNAPDATEQLSRYREACEVVKDNEVALFDTLVTHTTLPLTLALVGFLIGTKLGQKDDG